MGLATLGGQAISSRMFLAPIREGIFSLVSQFSPFSTGPLEYMKADKISQLFFLITTLYYVHVNKKTAKLLHFILAMCDFIKCANLMNAKYSMNN